MFARLGRQLSHRCQLGRSASSWAKTAPATLRQQHSCTVKHSQLTTGGRNLLVRSMAAKSDLHSLPGVTASPDPATKGFVFQQTMFRIKDPQVSLDFYTRVLGMTLLTKLDFPDMKFTLYFLAYENPENVPDEPHDRVEWTFSQKATLELTHNWGTESDPDFKGYHSGNSDPRGFGHIGFAVPDVYAACKRFEELGVAFQKRPGEGKMKDIAFIRDPDGYWIEILNAKSSRQFIDWPPASA